MTLKSKLATRNASYASKQGLQNELVALLNIEVREKEVTTQDLIRMLENKRRDDVWGLLPGFLKAYELECEVVGTSYDEDEAFQVFKKRFNLLESNIDVELFYTRQITNE